MFFFLLVVLWLFFGCGFFLVCFEGALFLLVSFCLFG